MIGETPPAGVQSLLAEKEITRIPLALKRFQSQPCRKLAVISVEFCGKGAHPGLNDLVRLGNSPTDADAFADGVVIGVCHLLRKMPGKELHIPVEAVTHGIRNSVVYLEVCEIRVGG